jgi:hypothetical protein
VEKVINAGSISFYDELHAVSVWLLQFNGIIRCGASAKDSRLGAQRRLLRKSRNEILAGKVERGERKRTADDVSKAVATPPGSALGMH